MSHEGQLNWDGHGFQPVHVPWSKDSSLGHSSTERYVGFSLVHAHSQIAGIAQYGLLTDRERSRPRGASGKGEPTEPTFLGYASSPWPIEGLLLAPFRTTGILTCFRQRLTHFFLYSPDLPSAHIRFDDTEQLASIRPHD